MGAYLSKPLTDKETSSGSNNWLSYGCSSMQGWRRFQEDAHNCILDYDPMRAASFFAVYDGHGGAEVAKYCSLYLPNFILSQSEYTAKDKPMNPSNLLKKAFIDFDVTLTQPKAKLELKTIAGPAGDEDDDDDESGKKSTGKSNGDVIDGDDDDDDNDENAIALSEEDITELHEEATRPIEAVLRKQFRGEIPDFIQNLLSTFKKPGDAGPSTSSSVSETPCAGEPEGKKSPINEFSSKETLNTAGEGAEGSENLAVSDTVASVQNVVEEGEDNGNIEGTEEEVVADEDEEDDEDEDYDAEKDDVDFYDEENEEEEEDYEGGVEGEDDDDNDDDDDEEEEAGSVAVLPRPVGFNEPGVDSGSTACVAFILPELSTDEKNEPVQRVFLYVANAGDSRAVICRGGAAVELSEDHKPEDPSERARIQAAGGTVTADGRVNDGLNLSRAIGDHVYKQRCDLRMWDQMISALPDVTRTELLPSADEFVVIACDGIWNAMTSQAVIDFIYDRLHPELAPENTDSPTGSVEITTNKRKDEVEIDRSSPAFLGKICEELFDSCLAINTMGDGTGCDNMTCIILRFDDLKGLASQAVTRTIAQSPDDLSFLAEEDSIETSNAISSVQGDDEKFEPSSRYVPIPISVVTSANGNGEMGENSTNQRELDSSPTLSPVLKKARIDSSPKNGGTTVKEVDPVE